MKLTEIGKDIISVNEENYTENSQNKIHIIKLDFQDPNYVKMQEIFKNYSKTNRFIIDDKIKIYNSLLKNVNKKFYVMNTHRDALISFFKKNNKVVLNTHNLNNHEAQFIDNKDILLDILYNVEVIITNKSFYNKYKDLFMS